MSTDYLVPKRLVHLALIVTALLGWNSAQAQMLLLAQEPLFLTQSQPPLVMLNMARDHRLYYEAYNDYSDLDGDGTLDIGYKPAKIDYYGYFDSKKCYTYDVANSIFLPNRISLTKKCAGDSWSGDFLNYVTTSRMDALRKVLYGGYRSFEDANNTYLQRVFIPQDAHAWGKEYESLARDGYDITDYTPLAAPAPGRRHFFASVTLASAANPPLMRVLTNSSRRVWNWLSIERPVADDACVFGVTAGGSEVRRNCVTGDTAATGGWDLVSPSSFIGLQKTMRDQTGSSHPTTIGEMDTLIASGTAPQVFATTQINCYADGAIKDSYTDAYGNTVNIYDDCNPATPATRDVNDNFYSTVFTGAIVIPANGTYTFAVDGNNEIDFFIDKNRNGVFELSEKVVGLYAASGLNVMSTCDNNGNGNYDACPTNVGTITLNAGTYPIRFRHYEEVGQDGYRLYWKLPAVNPTRTDYTVKVKVCDPAIGLETNCKSYVSGGNLSYRPTGLLHQYGESDGMYFGLLTGSYDNNTQGGRLRRNVSSFRDELNDDGSFKTTLTGIARTINNLRISSFNYGDKSYGCGWITTRQMNDGECEMWGNPLGEMVYETLRYFSGKTTATSEFVNRGTTRDDALSLPKPTWADPYATYPYCSKPYIMAISDIYPSFDSDTIPGSYFSSFSGDVSGLSVGALGDTMWANEFGGDKQVFIGQSGAVFDSAPTPKTVNSFKNIRGLAPSEPTRQGSFSASMLAYHGRVTDLRQDKVGLQHTGFYSIALSTPIPTIEIPVNGRKVTIAPFAKSVGGSSIDATQGRFQPTNQIVDFYFDQVKNTSAGDADVNVNGGRPYYRFRINYEDVEQGADHDMDAIAVYEVWLNADSSITVNVVSEYAAGGIMQHMGYVIAGTTADGTYLVARDTDTAAGSDPNYFLDRPAAAGALPLGFNAAVNVGTACVNSTDNFACRTFTPAASGTGATLLKDPLWYAAKWGGFRDDNGNDIPDSTEWDGDGDGVPDNYFLVVNPLKLEAQMAAALAKISKDSGTSAALATNSSSLRSNLTLYQARFSSDGWGGELNAYPIKENLALDAPAWQAQNVMAGMPNAATRLNPATRLVLTSDLNITAPSQRGIPFRWNSMANTGILQTSLNKAWSSLGGVDDAKGSDRVDFLRGADVAGFRTRPCVSGTSGVSCKTNYLGDIVNSAAQYVGAPNFGYAMSSYKSFYLDRKDRTPMLYAGANDGMLHGFDANTGIEKLAYIPSQLYRGSRLSKLTAPDYGSDTNRHAFFVDSTPTIADVCSGDCSTLASWKTILVGGLGGGGQSFYALDITTPENFSESNASSIVMWEFGDKDDSDLGYTYSRPAVTRICTNRDVSGSDLKTCSLADTRWVVIAGQGYNNGEIDDYRSTSSYSHVFVLDAFTGALLKKISTNEAVSPNGMPTLMPIDLDGDGVADYAYGGDLAGNVWKFDLRTLDSAALAYKLYAAGTSKPITTSPEVVLHPNGGNIVLFGTGKYLEATDKASTTRQTFFGIWDKGSTVPTFADRHNLQQQTLYAETETADGVTFGGSSANAVDWSSKFGWYLDLTPSVSGSPSERVAYNPQMVGNLINFVTVIPSSDVCAYGGDSWDFLLEPLTGAQPNYRALQNSPSITVSGIGKTFANRRKSTVGISPEGTFVSGGAGTAIAFKGGSGGGEESFWLNVKYGMGRRLSWRELETD